MAGGPDNLLALHLRRALPLVALALVLGAWGASLAGRHRVGQLDLSGFGRCEDVLEALQRDEYVARHALPYARAAVLLDGLAFLALFAAAAAGGQRLAVWIGVAAVWLASAWVHALS